MMTIQSRHVSKPSLHFGAGASQYQEVYKIRRPDGLYSRGGTDAHIDNSAWNKKGKVWAKGPLTNHLLQYDGRFNRKIPDNWVVEKYLTVQLKVGEMSAADMMQPKFDNRDKERQQRQSELVGNRIRTLETELATLRSSGLA